MSDEVKQGRRRRRLHITGGIVPRGVLKPNLNHPFAVVEGGRTRREAFLDELAEALAELTADTGEDSPSEPDSKSP